MGSWVRQQFHVVHSARWMSPVCAHLYKEKIPDLFVDAKNVSPN